MKKKNKSPTVYDVAKLAGVSPSTVSRFLNRTTYVSDDKSRNIEDAINQVGYKPSFQIREGSNRRSMTIGVLVQHPDSPYTSRILNDMEKLLTAKGYTLVIATGQWNKRLETHALKYLENSNVDGVIIVTGNLPTAQIAEYALHTPVVAVGFDIKAKNVLAMNLDNELGGYIATLHLIQQGHQAIAHIKGLDSQPDAVNRLSGYKRAIREVALPIDNKLIKNGDFSSESGYKMTCNLIKSKIHFTAIFAANDQMAFGAIKALHDHGIDVPDQVSVVGFDDIPVAKYFTPALTTLRQPIEEIGKVCANSILSLLNGEENTAKLPPIELIVRESTKPPAH